MKKLPLITLLFAMFAILVPTVHAEDFDTVLRTAATELIADSESNLKTVAVVAIKTKWGESIADYIQSELEYYFVKKLGAGNVVSRDDFTKSLIANEIEYNRSGVVSDETLQEWGEIIGVDAIINGEFIDTAIGWQLILKITQTKTGKHLAIWRGKIDATDADVAYQIVKDGKTRPNMSTAPAVTKAPAIPAASKEAAPKPIKVTARWNFAVGKNAAKIQGIPIKPADDEFLEHNTMVPCDKGSGATLELLGNQIKVAYKKNSNNDAFCVSSMSKKRDLFVITTEAECTLVICGHARSSEKDFTTKMADGLNRVNGFDVNGVDVYTRTKPSDCREWRTWKVPLKKGRNVIAASGMFFESFVCK